MLSVALSLRFRKDVIAFEEVQYCKEDMIDYMQRRYHLLLKALFLVIFLSEVLKWEHESTYTVLHALLKNQQGAGGDSHMCSHLERIYTTAKINALEIFMEYLGPYI